MEDQLLILGLGFVVLLVFVAYLFNWNISRLSQSLTTTKPQMEWQDQYQKWAVEQHRWTDEQLRRADEQQARAETLQARAEKLQEREEALVGRLETLFKNHDNRFTA